MERNELRILRTGERLWLVMFTMQLAYLAVRYDLDTWDDEQMDSLLWVQADIGRLN